MAIMPEVRDPRTRKTPNCSQVLSPTGQSGTGQGAPQAREGRACLSLKQVERTRPVNDLATFDLDEMRRTRRHANVRLGARLLAAQAGQGIDPATARRVRYKPVMLTLTYAEGKQYDPRDVSACLKAIKRQAARQGCQSGGNVWVSELQARGALHYHVVLWIDVRHLLAHPDKSGAWPHGMSNLLWLKDGDAAAYLAGYCSKDKHADELAAAAGHRYPKGCRRYGCGGLSDAAKRVKRYAFLPRYMREQCTVDDDVRRARGGGFASRETGQHWDSEWICVAIHGRRATIVKKGHRLHLLMQVSPEVRNWVLNATRNSEA